MRMRWVLPACLLLTAAVRADSLEAELERLQGKWTVEVLEENGEREPDEEIKRFAVRIRGTTMVVRMGEREETMSFRLRPDQSPKGIDLTPNYGMDKGKLVEGIYDLTDDVLRIVARPRGERPKEFVSGKGVLVLILKRDK